MENKLKPCPFCGRKPKICKRPKFPKGLEWSIYCDRDNVRVHTCSMETRKEAIAAWNRREK